MRNNGNLRASGKEIGISDNGVRRRLKAAGLFPLMLDAPSNLIQQVDAYEANKSKSFATASLPSSTISEISKQTMDPRHDHLNNLL